MFQVQGKFTRFGKIPRSYYGNVGWLLSADEKNAANSMHAGNSVAVKLQAAHR